MVMYAFLLIGYLHFIIYAVIVYIVLVFLYRSRQRRDQKLRSSKVIMKNLLKKKVKFSTISSNAPIVSDTQISEGEIGDNSCIICWTPYEQTEDVIRLTCNEKHFFHASCLESWVNAGNNSCPMCRKPIDDSVPQV